MHWVDRGPEPAGLGKIRSVYTPRWIQYYKAHVGQRPTDSYWLNFLDELEGVFKGLCAYCEEYTFGEVDHFQPKSKFPHLVYTWGNWLFACHECNHSKLDKWPADGYVDPCAILEIDRPEHYFVFDTQTGRVMPNGNLTADYRKKAQETIDHIGINNLHHRKKRVVWLTMFSATMPANPGGLTGRTREIIARFASREMQLSSFVRAWLSEHGYPMEHLGSE